MSWLTCLYCCCLECTPWLESSELQQKLLWAATALSNLAQRNRTSCSFWGITKPFQFSLWCCWEIRNFFTEVHYWFCGHSSEALLVLFFLEMISQKLLSLPLSGWICMTCTEKFIYSNSHWKVIHFPPKCLHSRNSILLISSVIMWLGNTWLRSSGFGAESLAEQSHSDWKCGLVAG